MRYISTVSVGYKFDEKEEDRKNEERKLQKSALGLQDSDDEAEEAEELEKKLEKIFSNKPKSELISIIKMITTDHALCRSGTWKYRLSSFCSATTSCIKVCRYQLINLTRNAFSLYHIKLNIEFIYLFYKWYKRYFHIMCIIN
jgi:hypothetical protein